ncbi:hypothetical protein [Candidatus Tisiphia endosymbiont of Ceraclea dissimilis]|uniref:hypothetical protein n=1 Tax=Candidatus Tisiphia endosymbiont of Ceraclea dissimilis TaxID=3077928 RepID=UPI003CCA9F17
MDVFLDQEVSVEYHIIMVIHILGIIKRVVSKIELNLTVVFTTTKNQKMIMEYLQRDI